MTKIQLLNKINKFLKTKVKNDGTGWTPIDRDDLGQLQDIFSDLIDLKWDRDCDNDVSLQVKVIDRTKFEPNYFENIPYDKGDESFTSPAFACVMSNLKRSTEKVDHYIRMVEFVNRENKRNEKTNNNRSSR